MIISQPDDRPPIPMLHSSLLRRGLRLLALSLTVLSSGCVYHMAIQQGNFLEQRSIDQLQLGMTRSQVRYILGTPMVPTTFDSDRWDYLYYLRRGHIRKPEEYDITVYFEKDKVSRIDNHGHAKINSEPHQTEKPIRPAV
jgi:outer membrane protein assembly factor BamE